LTETVQKLMQLGSLPSSESADQKSLMAFQELLDQLTRPVSDEDAKGLMTLFGPDESFGLAWTLIHLIESSPGWPIMDCLNDPQNEWIARLRDRALRS